MCNFLDIKRNNKKNQQQQYKLLENIGIKFSLQEYAREKQILISKSKGRVFLLLHYSCVIIMLAKLKSKLLISQYVIFFFISIEIFL